MDSNELKKLKDISPFKLNVLKRVTDYYQILYASQLYGTFFAVGAKLNLVNDNKELISIDLVLVNYKGLYNLRMTDKTEISFSADGTAATLNLHLSVFEGIHGNEKVKTLNCKDKAPNFVKLKSMDVTRHLQSFSKHSSDNMTNHLFDDCFDSEFYERDGAAIVERNRMDDRIEEYDKVESEKVESAKFIFGTMSAKTGVCRTSTIEFVD